MGMVPTLNKGDVKGSEVSKKVKDVAKGMKKSDVKKYTSTKHKGKPNKVKKRLKDKIREMIRMELEGCGYGEEGDLINENHLVELKKIKN